MTFQLDTTGAVLPVARYDPKWIAEPCGYRWSDLSPFTQGYIEALFAASVDPRGRMMMPRDGRYASAPRERRNVAFRMLAPETLARIIADCESAAKSFGKGATSADGRRFYHLRQSGVNDLWRPQALQLCDEGKVRFA